ncbi:MAG: ParB/RepB/Spo0J family partition protein [Chloroflexi bacterium]|nr:ParB/RepB/Spo0J family partition protein [Chloroflexota bacterium]
MTRRGLGRGLSSLIPPTPPSPTEAETSSAPSGLRLLPIDDIAPNPRQPRQVVDAETLAELAASIKEHGLIQPIVVTIAPPEDATPYIIIAGERRWRASKLAGLTEVPAVVKEATPQNMLEIALVENIQRADLNPLEEAAAYHTLIEEFGLTQEQVAERVGKSRVAVTNIVRLLRLPHEVKQALLEGHIREGHARALLGLNDERMMVSALEMVIDRGLSVRQTEEVVRRLNAPPPEPSETGKESSPREPNPETKALEERLRAHLGTKVNLYRSRKGGRIVIHFYSEEELAEIYDKLIAEPL